MKKTNKTKIALALGLLCTGMASQAQWATFNVSDALYDYFRSMRDYVQNSNLEAISNGQQLQMAQANQNVTNADYRNRLAMSQNSILNRDQEARPTYELCIAITKSQSGSASVSSSMNGGRSSSYGNGGGGGGRPDGKGANPDSHYAINKPTTIQENIRSTENAQAMVINNISKAKTCDPRYGAICGNTKEPGEYALADVSSFGILSNSAKTGRKPGQDIQNHTINQDGYTAGLQYVNVASLANAPKYPDPTLIQKNPGYVAMYNGMIIKLNAASETLKSILDMRRSPSLGSGDTSITSSIWTTTSKDWDNIFPQLVKPTLPSLYDYLNYRVTADVFGKLTLADDATLSGDDLMKNIQSKIAMNNLIAWNQYQQQEKTNILLSHILIQQTTPSNKDALDREYQKFNQR